MTADCRVVPAFHWLLHIPFKLDMTLPTLLDLSLPFFQTFVRLICSFCDILFSFYDDVCIILLHHQTLLFCQFVKAKNGIWQYL